MKTFFLTTGLLTMAKGGMPAVGISQDPYAADKSPRVRIRGCQYTNDHGWKDGDQVDLKPFETDHRYRVVSRTGLNITIDLLEAAVNRQGVCYSEANLVTPNIPLEPARDPIKDQWPNDYYKCAE